MINVGLEEAIQELTKKFYEIKSMGWIKSNRKGDTGIGKTFEDVLNKKEDNLSEPDYKGIEIKSQRELSSSMITLFTKSPDFPTGVNTFLREKFGNESPEYNEKKILHTTISATKFNSHISGNDFKIEIDKENKRIYIVVRSHGEEGEIFKEVYWKIENICKCLERKLKCIAYVTAEEKKEGGITYFKYTGLNIITGLNIEKFLDALESGDIKVDIRIGVYNSGKNIGKTHDHGTRI